jgi:VanZ family protein
MDDRRWTMDDGRWTMDDGRCATRAIVYRPSSRLTGLHPFAILSLGGVLSSRRQRMTSDRQRTDDRPRSWRQVLLRWAPAVVWMALIFFLSSQSGLGGMQLPPLFQVLRKSGHVVEYAVLGLLLIRALAATWRPRSSLSNRASNSRTAILATVVSTVYAISDEYHQSFVPRRGAHLEDVMLDTLSGVLAVGVWYLLSARGLDSKITQMGDQ